MTIYVGMTDPYILAESRRFSKNLKKIAELVQKRNPENVFSAEQIFFHPLTGSSEVSYLKYF